MSNGSVDTVERRDDRRSAAQDTDPAADGVARHQSRAVNVLYRYAVVLVLAAMVATFSVLTPDTFFTFANLRVITSTQTVLIIAVVGLTLPFSAGEFDLSFGAVIAWSSTLLAVLTVEHGWPAWLAMVVVMLTAAGWGLVNALFVVGVGISSLITTLGSSTIIVGLTLAIADSQVIAGPPRFLFQFATNKLFGLPYPVYLALGFTTVVWIVQDHTPLGRYLYFTGEGREVARLSGLAVDRLRAGALVASSTICGFAGILNFGRLGSADPNLGTSFLLPGTAAVFLGATVIKPGRFNAWGTVVAVFLLVTGVTGLQHLGGAGWLEDIFNGLALILAVTFAHLTGGRRNRV